MIPALVSTTRLANVSTDADVTREEMFGPVTTLIPFDTDELIVSTRPLEFTESQYVAVDW